MDYKAIMEIMEQEQENQPMASEETQNAYSALDDAINAYAEAVQKDAFYFGYITAVKQMKEGKQMRKIESGEDLQKLDCVVYELDQLNALIGFMQVAFAEGASATDEAEAAAALWHIYYRQGELIKQIKELYGDRG